ncbi:MAG: hypothetical protein NT038_06320 [Euryarchaeota archaeon]|nr:hypothetical protein [Euryarchaeota archaeon]
MKKIAIVAIGILFFATVSASGIIPIGKSTVAPYVFSEQQKPRIPPIIYILHELYEKNHLYQKLYNRLMQKPLTNEHGFVFSPKPVNLSDDAFHGADTIDFTEWWYFDAILNDGYSIQLIFQVISLLDRNVLSTKINMYQNGKLVANAEKIFLPDEFFISKETPLITINGKQVMNGEIDHGQWIYDVSVDINDVAVDLCFVGTTCGWKGDAPVSKWAVILPKADVQGMITINNQKQNVMGTGYHDHNWELNAQAGKYFGWLWGKISTGSVTVVWSSILDTRFEGQPILVINIGAQEYQSIDPSAIRFTADEIFLENGKMIPHKFVLHATTDTVSVSLTMTVETIHHVKVGTITYWRYHVHCLGSVTIDGKTELVDQKEIAEFVRFR